MGTDYTPRPKVAAGAGIGAPLGIIIVWVLSMFVTVPPEVSGAIGALTVGFIAYMWPDKSFISRNRI